jgi:hypothetical protein
MPETKGLSLKEIREIYGGLRMRPGDSVIKLFKSLIYLFSFLTWTRGNSAVTLFMALAQCYKTFFSVNYGFL